MGAFSQLDERVRQARRGGETDTGEYAARATPICALGAANPAFGRGVHPGGVPERGGQAGIDGGGANSSGRGIWLQMERRGFFR